MGPTPLKSYISSFHSRNFFSYNSNAVIRTSSFYSISEEWTSMDLSLDVTLVIPSD